MFDVPEGEIPTRCNDADEQAIRLIVCGLKGDSTKLTDDVELNLLRCATMAVFYGRRMGVATQDGFDALAALCLVLGERRAEFFENVFVRRMIRDPKLSAQAKLNRVVEIVIGTIPRPAPTVSNNNHALVCG